MLLNKKSPGFSVCQFLFQTHTFLCKELQKVKFSSLICRMCCIIKIIVEVMVEIVSWKCTVKHFGDIESTYKSSELVF